MQVFLKHGKVLKCKDIGVYFISGLYDPFLGGG